MISSLVRKRWWWLMLWWLMWLRGPRCWNVCLIELNTNALISSRNWSALICRARIIGLMTESDLDKNIISSSYSSAATATYRSRSNCRSRAPATRAADENRRRRLYGSSYLRAHVRLRWQHKRMWSARARIFERVVVRCECEHARKPVWDSIEIISIIRFGGLSLIYGCQMSCHTQQQQQ